MVSKHELSPGGVLIVPDQLQADHDRNKPILDEGGNLRLCEGNCPRVRRRGSPILAGATLVERLEDDRAPQSAGVFTGLLEVRAPRDILDRRRCPMWRAGGGWRVHRTVEEDRTAHRANRLPSPACPCKRLTCTTPHRDRSRFGASAVACSVDIPARAMETNRYASRFRCAARGAHQH